MQAPGPLMTIHCSILVQRSRQGLPCEFHLKRTKCCRRRCAVPRGNLVVWFPFPVSLRIHTLAFDSTEPPGTRAARRAEGQSSFPTTALCSFYRHLLGDAPTVACPRSRTLLLPRCTMLVSPFHWLRGAGFIWVPLTGQRQRLQSNRLTPLTSGIIAERADLDGRQE